jgi:hypothetical protein
MSTRTLVLNKDMYGTNEEILVDSDPRARLEDIGDFRRWLT